MTAWVGMIWGRIDNLILEKTHKDEDMLRKEYIQETWKGTIYMRFMLGEKWSYKVKNSEEKEKVFKGRN